MNTSTLFILLLPVFCAVVSAQFDLCDFTPPEKEIDWDRLPVGPWKWGLLTSDTLSELIACSAVTVSGDKDSAKLSMKYGPLSHQVYTMKGAYSGPGEYDLQQDFSDRWKNIIRYTNNKVVADVILNNLAEPKKENHMVFYTDYKHYLISAICLPTGRLSIGAYTMHNRVTPVLETRMRKVLSDHNISSFPLKINCKGKTPKLGKK